MSERKGMDALSRVPECLIGSLARLIRMTPVPECPRPLGERDDADVSAKPCG